MMKELGAHEIKEVSQAENPAGKTIKCFETSQNDVKSVRHIDTINEGYEGKKYPGTNVEYRRHRFKYDGKTYEGVFPKFSAKYETKLPKELYKASDAEQFKYCTEKLRQRIEQDPQLKSQFTERQLEQIKNGEPRISGLTWHHNEVPGKMQLVDAKEHSTCRHTGGRSIWGGGAAYR